VILGKSFVFLAKIAVLLLIDKKDFRLGLGRRKKIAVSGGI